MIQVLLILFTFISCNQESWETSLQYDLSFINKVNFAKNYLNKGDLKNPPNTWLKLATFERVNKKKCLFYKTPYREKKGVLKIVESLAGKCSAFSKGRVYNDNFSAFRINYVSSTHAEKSNILEAIYSTGKEQLALDIPLINITSPKKYERYDNQLDFSLVPDVSFGEESNQLLLENGKVCHGVNSECQEVVGYKCDKCQNGVVEVVDYNCPQGGSKYCGPNKCGKKNQIACPRGYKILNTKLNSLCFEGSPAGFCEPGLRTYCNEKNILICL